MAVFRCKMCGGALDINKSVAFCGYCGTQQTVPQIDSEKKANLYDRANHFRRNNEFDKAMVIYEQILNEDKTDAESYWSLVLCRYGIEYVEDPVSHKRVPTVNRAQFTSIFDDDNYKSAMEYADVYQKPIYDAEAKTINEIQKGILAISQTEEPFDVFICYKEADDNGRRTLDSVLANDLYHQLKQEGFKVFFSRITLEDKLGTAYEPYIFAALNSAKIMVVLGTKPEYFNAVWVKNEWSRYLALVKNSNGKKMLIPAYKDMNPYDLPEEFSHLQAQDMSKLGFMQDLIRGIKKIVQADEHKTTVVKETVVSGINANSEALLERGFLALEDGEWITAGEFFEQVLNQDAKNARAYLGKMMVELRVKKIEDLKHQKLPFDNSTNYQKTVRFADAALNSTLEEHLDFIKERNEKQRLEAIYVSAIFALNIAKTYDDFLDVSKKFDEIATYKDSAQKSDMCREKAEIVRKDGIYNQATSLIENKNKESYANAIQKLQSISDWRNSEELIANCQKCIAEINYIEEQKRIEAIKRAEMEKAAKEAEELKVKKHRDEIDKHNKKIKKWFLISVIALLVLPSIPMMFDKSFVEDSGDVVSVIAAIIFAIILDGVLQFVCSMPTLIPTVVFMLLKAKTQKLRKVSIVFNVLSKILLILQVGWYALCACFSLISFGDEAVISLGSGIMFLMLSICSVAVLVLSFFKKDYKY